MTRRRWIADRHSADRAWLTGANAVHLARALRARPGHQFEIATPDGVRFGTVTTVSDDEIEFSLEDLIPARSNPQTKLLLAVFKFDRFEWALEKAIELGATEIVPVIARRTEKHLATAAAKRIERWRRLAREAAQQSRQPHLPTIHDPLPLAHALPSAAPGLHILLAETPGHPPLWSVLTDGSRLESLTLAIGPIGGWTDDEFQLFAQNHWIFASLGDSVLRVETATIAGLAIVNQARLIHTRSQRSEETLL